VIKAHGESKGRPPLILNLCGKWRQLINLTSQLLYPQDRTPAPTKEEAWWVPEPRWTYWRKENSLVPAGIRTPGGPPRSLIATPTTKLQKWDNTSDPTSRPEDAPLPHFSMRVCSSKTQRCWKINRSDLGRTFPFTAERSIFSPFSEPLVNQFSKPALRHWKCA
jgi:hypothetical protein